jgi:NhaA family Na+:H+ antiporter
MNAPHASSSSDIAGSLVLLAATLLALIFANTDLATVYKDLLSTPIRLGLGDYALEDTLKSWIKNALMAVFFLYVGLEIKAEFMEGALATRDRAILPFAAAFGGMLVPALVYAAVVGGEPALLAGWAIPSATDIAFAVGVVGLLGARVSAPLKAFLLAVAVIDDLGAILIIALFYTGGISLLPLAVALLLIGGLALLNARGVDRLWPYLAVGAALWIAVHHSGVNPTLAGVVVALFVPMRTATGDESPLHRLGHALKGAVTFAIMPIFAFANAGVALAGLGLAEAARPVTLGVALGLLVGKPVGITLSAWLATRSGYARLPEGASWTQIVGIGALAGIGFTMSLFIGVLAFGEGAIMEQVRLGVLIGSLAATLLGVLLLLTRSSRAGAVRPDSSA